MEQIIIRLISLPISIRGFTVVDADGNYNVYLNSNGNIESAFAHEMQHILRGDFWSEASIRAVEVRVTSR